MLSRNAPKITNAQALAAKPVRLVDATVAKRPDGGGTLTVPLAPPKRLKWLFRLPEGSRKDFELDAVGVFVWETLDGKTSVEQLIKKLAERYKLNLREAQVPTLQFLQTLIKKGLVGVPAEKS